MISHDVLFAWAIILLVDNFKYNEVQIQAYVTAAHQKYSTADAVPVWPHKITQIVGCICGMRIHKNANTVCDRAVSTSHPLCKLWLYTRCTCICNMLCIWRDMTGSAYMIYMHTYTCILGQVSLLLFLCNFVYVLLMAGRLQLPNHRILESIIMQHKLLAVYRRRLQHKDVLSLELHKKLLT